MKEGAFRSWLSSDRNYGTGTVNSRVSNCKTVEGCEGDLDKHFEQDRLRGLVEKLTYSKADERQNRAARHRIPINGNVYNGTATLRSAVSLYKQFRENWVEGSPIVSTTEKRERAQNHGPIRSSKGRTWPTWDQPGSTEVLALARATAPFVQFLSPAIVQAVVDDNEEHRIEWTKALQERQIDPISLESASRKRVRMAMSKLILAKDRRRSRLVPKKNSICTRRRQSAMVSML
jgi:hypothetical protein